VGLRVRLNAQAPGRRWAVAELLLVAGIGAAALALRLAHEQNAARSAAKEARRLKERDRERGLYLSGLSHGLRTPFTAVRAGIGLIESSAADRLRPDELQLLSEVQTSADRLGMRIRDLLSLNQLEAGAMVLERKPCDLRSIVADAITVVHPLIVQKGQTLEVDLPEPLPLLADENHLVQVVVNLIDNAHQHTPPGTRVAVTGTAEGDTIHLAVSDSGDGIPPEEQEAIFVHFHSCDKAAAGWGLGLAVARAVTELHGGQIHVNSAPGEGATFHVILPRLEGYVPG
jgi:two-component system sensor histidine kinase KdpD